MNLMTLMNRARIYPDWIVPSNICGAQSDSGLKDISSTTRIIKNSHQLNFSKNIKKFSLVSQIHSTKIIEIKSNHHNFVADSIFTKEKNTIVAIKTADCIPLLLTDNVGSFVGAVHCGWRGLCDGIIKKTLNKINSNNYIAWIGPSITKKYYETDRDIFDRFVKKDKFLTKFFTHKNNKFNVDLQGITQEFLRREGVKQIYGNTVTQDNCSFAENNLFFSYRRDKTACRQLTYAWIKK